TEAAARGLTGLATSCRSPATSPCGCRTFPASATPDYRPASRPPRRSPTSCRRDWTTSSRRRHRSVSSASRSAVSSPDSSPPVSARLVAAWSARAVFPASPPDLRHATLAAHHPEVDFRLIDGAGHWANWEAADAVNAMLLDVLGAGTPARA